MHPAKVDRTRLYELTDLPNVGKAMASDLRLLGYDRPQQLLGQCPYAMFNRLCKISGVKHDPCVIDVFIAITKFMDGEPPRSWWDFTAERKAHLRSTTA